MRSLRLVAVLVLAFAFVAGPAVAQLVRMPRPERVLLIGSSSIHHGFGEAVENALTELGGIQVDNAGRSATGLARLDHYDWLSAARERLSATRPQLVIAQFGGNDCQAVIDADGTVVARFGEYGWDEEYSERLGVLIDSVEAAGARLVFVGMPRMESASFSAKIEHVNEVVANVARARGVTYVSSWELTSDGDRPRPFVTVDGRTYDMREEDGIHLSVRGSEYVADAFVEALSLTYDLSAIAPAE